MAPPPKGTKAYKTYLEKQQLRRAKERLTRRKDKLAKEARPLICASVKEATKELLERLSLEVHKKNKYMRQNNMVQHSNAQLLTTNVAIEKNAGSIVPAFSLGECIEGVGAGSRAVEEPYQVCTACTGEVAVVVVSGDFSRSPWFPEQAEMAWQTSTASAR